MIQDDHAVATRADLRALKEDMREMTCQFAELLGSYYDRTHKEIIASEKRVKRHFDVAVEQVHEEMKGANRDEIQVIKDRVTRLEEHTGLVRA